jgi:hypothetical protein
MQGKPFFLIRFLHGLWPLLHQALNHLERCRISACYMQGKQSIRIRCLNGLWPLQAIAPPSNGPLQAVPYICMRHAREDIYIHIHGSSGLWSCLYQELNHVDRCLIDACHMQGKPSIIIRRLDGLWPWCHQELNHVNRCRKNNAKCKASLPRTCLVWMASGHDSTRDRIVSIDRSIVAESVRYSSRS